MTLLSKGCAYEKRLKGPGSGRIGRIIVIFFSQSVLVSHFLRISVTGRNL